MILCCVILVAILLLNIKVFADIYSSEIIKCNAEAAITQLKIIGEIITNTCYYTAYVIINKIKF